MVQVQIGFGIVVGDIYFIVLEWVYCVWIDVDVWIEFYYGYLQVMGFKDGGE